MPEEPIIIPGRAISVRARGARRYKQRIYGIAKPFIPQPLTSGNIRLQVAYFYATGQVVDLDNLLKCVLDGLSGAAYVDDSQVEEIWIRRYNALTSRDLSSVQRAWRGYLTRGEPFVSITVSENEDI